jgi:uncharacterized membrane protein
MDGRKRSIAKAITFRVLATLTTIFLVLALTGSWVLANTVGAIDVVSKLVIFYFHERAWDNVSWGRKSPAP